MVKFYRCLIILTIASLYLSVRAQQPQASYDSIAKLLELPAPLPESANKYFDRWENNARRPPIPGDDAPLDLLVEYWQARWRYLNQPPPSERIRSRLLEAAEKYPDELWRLVDWLPDTAESHARVKALLDRMPPADEKGPESRATYERQKVHDWLMMHSRYFRDELAEQAGNLRESDGFIHNEHVLIALTRLDWERSQPLLAGHVSSGSPRRNALALSLQYAHAIEAHDTAEAGVLRERLLSIAGDIQAPGYARARACDALLKSEWDGRDEWYISLLNDKTLDELKDGRYPFRPLSVPLDQAPNKWIPVISKFIGSSNRTIHDGAVSALLHCSSFGKARRETLLPLLPWLSDPNWTSQSSAARTELIRELMSVRVPESVPGLIAVLESGRDHYLMQAAARSLATYQAPQAGTVIRKAIAENRGDRSDLVRALVKCGTLTDQEKLSALEKYARHINRAQTFDSLDYTLVGGDFEDLEWRIGSELSHIEDAPVPLVSTLLARVKQLQRDDPELGRKLLLVIQRWPVVAIFQNIIERIAADAADDLAIRQLILHRDKLQNTVRGELTSLSNRGGNAAGIVAVLLSDKANQQSILRGQDRNAQYALLACARVAREVLALDMVSELYRRRDELVRLAAERYLETIDTSESRAVIFAAHPNDAVILGGRYTFDPRNDDWFKWEARLREEVKNPGGPDEIFAMGLRVGDQIDKGAVLRWRGDKATITKHQDQAREESRELSAAEIEEIRQLLRDIEFDDLSPQIYHPGGYSGASLLPVEFVRVNRNGGRRVFTNSVSLMGQGKTPYQRIYNLIDRLTKADGFKLRYYAAGRVKGLEVLYAADERRISYICKQDSRVLALVEEPFKGSIEELIKRQSQGLDNYDRSWRVLQAGELGETVAEPPACPILAQDIGSLREVDGPPESRGPAWQGNLGGDYIRAGYRRQKNLSSAKWGLWRLRQDAEPQQIADGRFVTPIVTNDGKWIVAEKHLWEGSKVTQELIRIDIKTLREHKTQIPITPGYDYGVIGEINGMNRVLVCRVSGRSPDEEITECVLLDPETGNVQTARGEVRPLRQQTFRSLQVSGDGTRFWAAIPDPRAKNTQLGLYDAKKFAFTPLLDLPEIHFDSMQMWVDEAGGYIYVAYEGQALRLPLPKH